MAECTKRVAETETEKDEKLATMKAEYDLRSEVQVRESNEKIESITKDRDSKLDAMQHELQTKIS